MPIRRDQWQTKVKAVERDYLSASWAMDAFIQSADQNVLLVKPGLRIVDFKKSREGLEGTYLIRLFVEFEVSLRTYWTSLRNTHPPMKVLIDRLGSRFKVPFDPLRDTHQVREYRNSLVHELDEDVAFVAIENARRHLCIFLNYLPPEW